MSRTAAGRLISGVLFDIRSGARHRAPTSECMSWFLPRLGCWRAHCSLFIVLFSIRSPRRAAARPSCAGLIRAGRRLLSIRFPPSGVTGHHPYGLFTRVITAESLPPRRSRMGLAGGGVSIGGVEQAELAGAGDRRGAGPTAPFAGPGGVGGV